jgi:hypothetical protein
MVATGNLHIVTFSLMAETSELSEVNIYNFVWRLMINISTNSV